MRQHSMPRILDPSQAVSDNIVEYRDVEEFERWERDKEKQKGKV